MSGRSKGIRCRSRSKLTKHARKRGLMPINKAIQELPLGSRVSVILDPGVIKGQPHPRYQGRIGVVDEIRGRAYVVNIQDGGSTKRIISRPDHLRVVSG